MTIKRLGRAKKLKKNISSFLIVTILFTNLFPLFGIAFAQEADGSSTTQAAPTQTVDTATPATTDSSGTVAQTQQTAQTPLTEPTGSLIPAQSMDTTTAATATDTSAIITENASSTQQNPQVATGTASTTETTATDTNATTTFNGTASTTNEFISGGNSSLGTQTASTTNIFATTTIIDGEIYDLGTSTLPVGTTTIKTGDSVATANLLNLLNTNSLNSTGTIKLVNLLNGSDGGLDLRNSSSAPATDTCNLLECSGVNSVTAKITSDASIDNTLVLQAQTGTNTVDTVQNGVINTGNSFAGLNLVNFANTNFIDSNYFVLSLNSFNTVNGDIVLPGLSTLFAKLTGTALGNITSNQLAETQNNLDINTNSGNNQALNSLSSNINSGDINSSTNVYNNSNSNLIGGNSIQLLLRVSGNWLGKLLGLPDGTQFIQDGNIRILQMDNGTTSNISDNMTTVESTSTAKIVNGVKILSDTGNNLIANTENATINTGNAYAAANVINVSNTNVIGKNWMLAIINIFGDFNGNISFGRPDIWIGEQILPDGNQIQNNTKLTYTLTVTNKGDANASGVLVTSIYDNNHLSILNSNFPYTEGEPGNLIFNLDALSPGSTKIITFVAQVKNTNPGDTISNTATVKELETDNDLSNNKDSKSVATYVAPTGGGGNGPGPSSPDVAVLVPLLNTVFNNNLNLALLNVDNSTSTATTTTATTTATTTQISFSVERITGSSTLTGENTSSHQSLKLTNLTNNIVKSATFYDYVYDQNGNQIEKETWDLGDIKPNEEISLDYDIKFGAQAKTGPYTLGSVVDFANNKKALFEKNGFINYIKNDVLNIAVKSKIKSQISSVAIPTDTGDYKSQDNSLNDLLNQLDTNVAHADVGQAATITNLFDPPNIYYSILSFMLMILSTAYPFLPKSSV